MGGDGTDGYYCTIRGGIPPERLAFKRIPVDGIETGIDRLDWIVAEARS